MLSIVEWARILVLKYLLMSAFSMLGIDHRKSWCNSFVNLDFMLVTKFRLVRVKIYAGRLANTCS